MAVEQIKHHPFFYGVNWNQIRQIDAPFIPRLKSITDTSYFPTDELEQVPEEPVSSDSAGANKDLAFLGCVQSSFFAMCQMQRVSPFICDGGIAFVAIPFAICNLFYMASPDHPVSSYDITTTRIEL